MQFGVCSAISFTTDLYLQQMNTEVNSMSTIQNREEHISKIYELKKKIIRTCCDEICIGQPLHMKMAVFWALAPCILVVHRRFTGTDNRPVGKSIKYF
jgi:hypothetical protein